MARAINKLSPLTVSKLKEPGYYSDGAGLYLQISATGTKSWIFKFTLNARAREMGLGSLNTFSLAEARDMAAAQRKLLFMGKDPIAERDAARNAMRLENAKQITFSDAAKQYIATHKGEWTNKTHAEQWESTIETFCSPIIGKLPVSAIDTGLIHKCLDPIWNDKTETAKRLRGRIEKILDWATTRGYRTGENPARWKGHLEHSLSAPSKVQKIEHHPALPYAEIGAFAKRLRDQLDTPSALMEFTILTATRSGESRLATWAEIDLDAGIWTIPADRMKLKREHRVPLSARCIEILKSAKNENDKSSPSTFVFRGRGDKALGRSVFDALLRRMERTDITTHGFRSSFRDWAAEMTNYPREVAEMALAHAIPDKVEAAYRRGDLFEKRRRMMADWSKYCATSRESTGNVLPMQKSNSAA